MCQSNVRSMKAASTQLFSGSYLVGNRGGFGATLIGLVVDMHRILFYCVRAVVVEKKKESKG